MVLPPMRPWLIWPTCWTVAASQLCVLEPSALRSRLPGGCLRGATATFAPPLYADRIQGRLLWTERPCEGQSSGNDSAAWAPERAQAARYVVLLERSGGCSFAQKARAAASQGAQALVVVDRADSLASSEEVQQTLVGGDDGRRYGLVPTLFLGREAEPLAELAADSQAVVEVELRWDLLGAEVKLDLWLSAYHPAAADLLRQLAPVARALGKALVFHPHYHVRALPAGASHSVIAQDCLHSLPQFCTEGTAGLRGAALLEEAMRQHCVHALGHGAVGGASASWWDYVERLAQDCPEGSTVACSRGVLATCGLDIIAVDRCVAERGLTFLEDDRESRAWWSSAEVIIRINDGRYSGPLTAISVSRAVCRRLEVFPEACAAFKAVVEAPARLEVPRWVLIYWCILTFLASSAALWCASCLGARCHRARRKCA
uniref:PA domain-containing protein n=1 Tax=Alexandrium monilatum TaxID=311494 RepID=A0A7S4RWY6_9DINO